MPRIDPQQLLTCLTPLLAHNGGIKSAGEVIRLANLMEKYSKKLVSKCIYIQILKCTETDLLGQFMAAGGWNLVHNWLRDGVESNNWAFIQELLEMLLLCPVDGNRLKSNHTPKIVKNLSISCVHQTVKILSSKLVEQWLRIAHQEKQQLAAVQNNGIIAVEVKTPVEESTNDNKVNESLQNGSSDSKSEDENSNKKSSENIKYKVNSKEGSGKLLLTLKRSTSPSVDGKEAKISRKSSTDTKSKSSSSSKSSSDKKSSGSSSSSHRSSSKSSHKDRERASSSSSSHHKSSSKDKDKHSSRSSSSKSSSSSSSSRDKDKKRDSRDKEKSQAEKDKETLDFLTPVSSTKLQRIPKRQHSENSENKSAESNEASPTNKVEKKKPSISIEVRKGEKPKTVKTLNSQFRNHGLAEEPPKPPSRKDLKKPAVPVPSSLPTVAKASISPPPTKKIHLDADISVPERIGGVKLIKPKPMIMESIGFMDALASAAAKKDPKKKKRLPSTSSKKDEPESPKIDVKPLKFYKDTLEENEEESTNGEKSPTKEIEADMKNEDDKLTEVSEGSVEGKTDKSPVRENDEPEEKRKPGIGCGPDGPAGVLVDPNTPRRKKRPIRWRPDEELTEIRFFELDETERTNVSKTFTEQKQMEHVEERSAFQLGRKTMNDDTMVEQTKWRQLIPIDDIVPIAYGSKSSEVAIQAEREKNVLQEIYFRHSLNDSPKEPDPESYEHIEPQIVPLEDVTGNPDSVTNFTEIQWPAPKGELPLTFSSNAFANVFSSINIPPAIGIPPIVGITNPLAAFANPANPIITPPWLIPPAPFMQPPPTMIAPQVPPPFAGRVGMNHNNNNNINNNSNFRGNNGRPYNNNNNNNNNAGNWVRGNTRRGTCNQFQRTGVCRNKNCPYIHER